MARDLLLDLHSLGGVARTATLRRLGHTSWSLRSSPDSTWAPRRGWISCVRDERARAVELGGRLGSASALASAGVWVDEPRGLEVAVTRTASRLPPTAAGELRLTCRDELAPGRWSREWRVEIGDALLQYARRASRIALIASIDSALHRGVLSPGELDIVLARLPRRLGDVRGALDGRAESGNESRLRVALRARGLHVVPQRSVAEVGRVDLLVDGWLIAECDSSHHDGAPNQHDDRRRDGNAVLLGLAHVRFSPRQVQRDLDWCVDVVEARLRAGRPRQGGRGAAPQKFLLRERW